MQILGDNRYGFDIFLVVNSVNLASGFFVRIDQM